MKTNTTKEINFTLDEKEAEELHRALTVEKNDTNFDYYRSQPRELTNKLYQFLNPRR